jgi:hypothetical protein
MDITLKMVTTVFGETLDSLQHSTRLIPESRSFTLNSSRESLNTRIYLGLLLPSIFSSEIKVPDLKRNSGLQDRRS